MTQHLHKRIYGKVLTYCIYCNSEIHSFNSRIRDGKGRFCSKDCTTNYYNLFKRIALEERLETQCDKSSGC